MNKKQLLDLGLTEELAEQIVVLHGKDIESHKTKLLASQEEATSLKTQLAEAGVTIEGFKKLDIEGVRKSADEWKKTAEKTQADSAAQLSALRFDHALDSALTGAKAKNAKAVKALLKAENLKLSEDGTIVDLDRQLVEIKKENDYLFESDTPTPRIITGGTSKTVISDSVVDAARKAAGLPRPK